MKNTEFGHDFRKINISMHSKIDSHSKNANPGPGTYEPSYYDIAKQPSKTTFKGRTKTSEDNKMSAYVPGPGAYTPRMVETAPSFSLKSRVGKDTKWEGPGPGEYTVLNASMGKDAPSYTLKPRLPAPTKSNDNPGPGTYQSKTTFGDAQKFTLKGKIPALNMQQVTNPGPGTYSIPTSFGSARAFSLSPRIADNSSKHKAYIPGPGTYTPREAQTNVGTTLKPRLHATNKNDNPGPGTYSPPTTMGHGPKHVFGTSA